MLGSYPAERVKQISALRTEECARVIEGLDGEIVLMNALLGQFDLAFIAKFPDNTVAIEASIALMKITGIKFITLPAISVSDFDQLAAEI